MDSENKLFEVVDGNINKDIDSTVKLWDKIKDEHQNDDLRGKLESQYLLTPHQKSVVFHLLDKKTSNAIGIQGIISRQFKYKADTLSSAVAADFVIDRQFRTLGPALYLFKQVASRCSKMYDFMYGFPNVKAAPVLKYAGYTVIDKVTRYSRVLNSKNILKKKFPTPIGSFLSIFANLALYIFDLTHYLYYSLNLKTINSDLDFRDIDSLWKNANNDSNLIFSFRDQSTLKWRFSGSDNSYRILKIYNKSNNSLEGYFIYSIENNICSIVDYYSSFTPSTVKKLFSLFIFSIRKFKPKAVLFEVMAPSDFIKSLKYLGFFERARRNIFFKSEKLPIDLLLDNMYITASDEDAI